MYKSRCAFAKCGQYFNKGAKSNQKYCSKSCRDRDSYFRRNPNTKIETRANVSTLDKKRIVAVELLEKMGWVFVADKEGMRWVDTRPKIVFKSFNTELPTKNNWEEAYREYYRLLTSTYGKTNHRLIDVQVIINDLEVFARTHIGIYL